MPLTVNNSYPSIYVVSINVIPIYVIKFFTPSNINLCRHSIYVAFFGTNFDVNRWITVYIQYTWV